jgi:uncharacterized protein
MMDIIDYVLVIVAAVAAGLVNALAGGGTLLTFPMLTAVGLPAVSANITSTMALVPGYFGATLAQLKDLKGQERRMLMCAPVAVVGGLLGGWLLLNTEEKLFRELVPFLILFASLLLAIQDPVKAWLTRRAKAAKPGSRGLSQLWVLLPVGLAAVYGGYFGAGVSVIFLAVLALVFDDTLTRINGLKQGLSFSANIAAASLFLFSEHINWPVALVMAVGAVLGGTLGGKLAGRIKPATLRMVVVGIGVTVSIIYFVR